MRKHAHTCTHTCGPPSLVQAVRRVSERSRTLSTAFSLAQPASHEEASGGGNQSFSFLVGEETPGSSQRKGMGPSHCPPAPLPAWRQAGGWGQPHCALCGWTSAPGCSAPWPPGQISLPKAAGPGESRGPLQNGSRGSSPEVAGEAGSPRMLARLTPTHASSPHLLGAYSLCQQLPPDTSWPPPQLCPPLSSPLPPPASTNLSQTQHAGLLHLCTFACAGLCTWPCFPHAPQDWPQPPRAFPGSPAGLPRLGPSAEEQGTAASDYGLRGLGQECRAACLLQNRRTINKGPGRGRTGNGHKSVCGPELSHAHVFSFYLYHDRHHHQHHVQWR